MKTNLIEELRWRGMLHDITPGTEEQLNKEMTTGYIGFDPTADSLHIGSLVPIILLVHMQRAGHKPIALVGGATGMIGDPSGKPNERNLLDEETLSCYVAGIQAQLKRFLDFDSDKPTAAVLVNNYDWVKQYSFIDFAREVGKHLTVNYMMSKDSVKKRLSVDSKVGMSFTEFTYQLLQGYDFLYLYKEYNCKLQMGGSDQWGNITTGKELIRRKIPGAEAHAATCPLITKADGSKFGKSEGENIWLDAERTSPYKFYQFWLNTSDADAEKYIKIFTFLSKEEIEKLIASHQEMPHKRLLQQTLAEEITVWVHGRYEYDKAIQASQILFGKSTAEAIKSLDENTLLSVFEGVPKFELPLSKATNGIDLTELLCTETDVFPSKGDFRRSVKGNAISLNKEKLQDENYQITEADLIAGKHLLVQKGKKNYYLISFC